MRSFIDTNVLLYADSGDEPVKHPQALALVERQLELGTGVVSTQVLHEFANIALRKFGLPLSLLHERLRLYARFEVVQASIASL